MKTTISRAEHLQLIGLFTLAESHNNAIKDIEQAALDLLGIADADKAKGDGTGKAADYLSDGMFGGDGIRTMFQRLGIKVGKR